MGNRTRLSVPPDGQRMTQRVRKALVTLATGTHAELLEIAMPSFEEFADRHGYDIVIPALDCGRPVSWWKIPALKAALEDGYDEALWVDADIVIVDPSEDLPVPTDAWQALVRHTTGDGDVPNCGVWLVRQPMLDVLDDLWALTHRINHGWWEQAALMDLLGWQHDMRPAFVETPNLLFDRTCWLDGSWNVHRWDTPGPEQVRFLHASMHPDRAAVMQSWANGDIPEVPDTPCRHLYPIVAAVDHINCPYCLMTRVTA